MTVKLGSGEKSTARDMTRGPILGQLVLFALPLMLGNVFQMLYNTVDSVIVGNFVSKQALAAIGSTTVIVNMLVFFFAGFSIGAGVVIGRYFGARNLEKLHDAVQTTMASRTAGMAGRLRYWVAQKAMYAPIMMTSPCAKFSILAMP